MKKTFCIVLKKTFFLLSITFLFFNIGQSSAQYSSSWEWVHPAPQGNLLRWCKIWDADNWYASGSNGTFMKTSNGGLNWYISQEAGIQSISGGKPGDVWKSYFFDMNTGILVGQAGATKTTDGGITFEPIPALSGNWYSINISNSQKFYITGSSGKLATSTDGGNTWNILQNISTGSLYDFYTPDDTLMILCSSAGNILRTTNAGINWDVINTGATNTLNALKFLNPDTGFVCGNSGAISLTTDGGLNWTNINNGLPLTRYTCFNTKIIGQTTEVYLTGQYKYIFRTTDLGTTWDSLEFQANQNIDNTYYYHTDFASNGTILTVGQWGLANKYEGPSNKVCYSKFAKLYGDLNDIWAEDGNGKVIAVGRASIPGVTFDQIMLSTNGGINWSIQSVGNSSANFKSISMVNPVTGYICGTTGEIRKTTDGGAVWFSLTSPASVDLEKIEFEDANTGWVFGASGTIFKTTDGGLNWTQQVAPGFTPSIYCSDMINPNTGWLGGMGGNIYKTTDGGLNWIKQNVNIGSNAITDIKMLDESTGYFCANGTVRKTINGGDNWEHLQTPISAQWNSLDFINSSTGFVSGFAGFTLKTTDGGSNWEMEKVQTYGWSIYAVSEDTAYLVSGDLYSYILKYAKPDSAIGIISWQQNSPCKFNLLQNYPNPFNPATTISFTIPVRSFITLKIFDITGKEIEKVFDNLPFNPGTVKYVFNGSNLASGVYFYSLWIDNKLFETRKMVLIK